MTCFSASLASTSVPLDPFHLTASAHSLKHSPARVCGQRLAAVVVAPLSRIG